MIFDLIAQGTRRLWAILPASLMASALAAPSQPTIDIATSPLSLSLERAYPNVLLTLSVEWPTAGAAYRGSYAKTEEYVGYFNPRRCYTYDEKLGYFVGSGNTDSTYECEGKFSGNFMNWAAASAIDELRMAMTGGDRVIDKRDQTVLQRALVPSYAFRFRQVFPAKVLDGSGKSSRPSGVTPFKHGELHIASCGNHVFFSPIYDQSATCDRLGSYNDTATERRAFRAQVMVCDRDEALSRTELCHSYNGRDYKPIGQMQRYASKTRFAAFSYLNDNYSNRYGGVLRAPMKYVGPTATDSKFRPIANSTPEWDENGVLRVNPLGDRTYGQSGVINYLNKFGRTSLPAMDGPPATDRLDNPSGNYKGTDPISELFYESIRYLQYHPDGPTPEAFGAGWERFTDKFPAYNKWEEDPLLGSCQRNYVILIGDIDANLDHYVPGNSKPPSETWDAVRPVDTFSGFDVMKWTNKVGALETNTPEAGNRHPLRSAFLNLGRGYQVVPYRSYYLAGTAYWAHTSEFNPNRKEARVTTYAIDVNQGGDGTVRDTERQSQIYLAAKYGGFRNELADGGNGDGNPFLALESGGTAVPSNKEWEAAPPGSNVPYNWFLASQPRKMIDGIKQIFEQIASGSAGMGGMAVNTSRIQPGSTAAMAFVPGYDVQWNGTLTASPLAAPKGKNAPIALSSPRWEAGERLGARKFESRSIFSLGGTGRAIPFTWDSLDSAQKSALDADPETGKPDGRGEQRINYLRGDRSQEQATQAVVRPLRPRRTLLGDAVNSGPVHVGSPAGAGRSEAYETFRSKYASRAPMVYLGTNDGMLHGFDARTGYEVFAYVPRSVFRDLNQLTSPSYSHRNFVDATPVTGDAQIGDTWHTVLAGGLGGGAQGLYALDITDPEGSRRGRAFGTGDVLWEFTDRDDPDMGNVMGTPSIARLRTGYDALGKPVEASFVVTGNGLNSNLADGDASSRPTSALFLLRIDKPLSEPWKLNKNYFKIVTPRSVEPGVLNVPNGLSAPVVIANAAGLVHTVYAGNLLGHLWKFNLEVPSSSWHGDTNGVFPVSATTMRPEPLFRATSAAGDIQPITMAPSVAHALGGYMVLFGTGKYYELKDTQPDQPTPNAFYGIYDDGKQFVPDRSLLHELKTTSAQDGAAVAWHSDSGPIGWDRPAKPGWLLDFFDPAERQTTAATLANGFVHFNSLTTSTQTCNSPGNSRSYSVNILTGMPADRVSGKLSTDGILGPPLSLAIGTTLEQRSNTGQIRQTETQQVLTMGTTGKTTSSTPTTASSIAGRLNWREIRNFGQHGSRSPSTP